MTEKEILNLKLELLGIDYAYSRSDLFDAKSRIMQLEFVAKSLMEDLQSIYKFAGIEEEGLESLKMAKILLNKYAKTEDNR
jgi:hypothetical protein